VEWDLGLWGVAYLLAMSLVFGGVAQLVAAGVTTRWMWLIAAFGFFALGLVISEVFFGWADAGDLQPNIDGLSRDEVLLGAVPGIAAVLYARRWGLHRHGRGGGRRWHAVSKPT
jgi:hypothetical protein